MCSPDINRNKDAAFCYLCLIIEHEKKFLASTKCDPALINIGYTNWRDATKAFNKHLSSTCHKEAVSAVELPKQTISERSFSAMRRLKTYLRSTMSQSRLNHVMLLTLNKEKVDQLDIDNIADQFVQESQHCLCKFGKFIV